MTFGSAYIVLILLGSATGMVSTSRGLIAAMDQTADAKTPDLETPVQQTPSTPLFRSAIDRVTIFATVRNDKGQLVRSLSPADFELLDQGELRRIIDFRSDRSAVSIALLVDVSGSMAVGANALRARQVVEQVLLALESGTDESAIYTFDTELRELRPFSTEVTASAGALHEAKAFGATSIWDAVAAAAPRVVERSGQRRALVVLTDGADTSSRSNAREVSGLASSIDVPVYVIATETPLTEQRGESLASLARWTGGAFHVAKDQTSAVMAARQIVDELRHQYFLAFEPSATPGWHPIVVRARDSALSVRARSGYIVAATIQR